jgi:serine/threonine-protein kinase
MAEVLLAATEGGKLVVLKRIWADLATDPDFVTMFRDEARLAIRLSHPNVVQTYEVVEDAQQLAMAMEYLHGQQLATIISRAGGSPELSLALRLRVLADVLAGLHYAHEMTNPAGRPLGVVHRDVSPENVFVTYDGQVKLMDFGVAQSTAAAHNTRPGVIKGKLAYMAPDYFRHAGVVDRRADVFSVGVMLWELLAGHRLWHGMGEAHIVHHLAAGMMIPNLPHEPGRPPVLDRICARALTVDPADRYATAADLESDLRGVLAGIPQRHPRGLADVVAGAFSEARAEREALIARALDAGGAPGPAPAPQWAQDIEILLPTVDGTFDVTVVDKAAAPQPREPPPPPPARRSGNAAVAVTTIGLAAVGLALVVAGVKQQRLASPEAAATPPAAVVPATHAEQIAIPPAELEPAPAPVAAVDPIPSPPPPPSPSPIARRAGAARRHLDRAPPAAVDVEASPFEELKLERRPAAVRAIDESDPFK